jgi:hypothetical protein
MFSLLTKRLGEAYHPRPIMTFYEAALRILEGAGHPLHIQEITQKSLEQNLLSHVGKTPEVTMLSRLAAMARRKTDRRVVVTAKDTFALSEWQLPEDAEALAQTGVPLTPEEELPPLRGPERHPEPRTENLRSAGRQERYERRRRREEGEDRGKRRRFPPLPEVVFELLSDSPDALTGAELLEKARAQGLASDELAVEQLLTALLEDNQRRIDADRRPQFLFDKATGQVRLEKAGAPSEAAPAALQAAFAEALGIPFEGGRPVLRSLRPQEAALPGEEGQDLQEVLKDARRQAARQLRKRLLELDAGSLEKAVTRTLAKLGFRELKVAKRSKDGPLLTARRREGSVELRFAIRILRGSAPVDRRAVQELRKDLGHYSAQVGLLASPADVRGDARGEAQSHGALVMLWCQDALGEKFLEARTGVTVTQVELFTLDEAFFETARVEAEDARRRREERHEERHRGPPEAEAHEAEAGKLPEPVESLSSANEVPPPPHGEEAAAAPASRAAEEAEEGEEGEEEGEEGEGAQAEANAEGQPGAGRVEGEGGERRRRRRRRRRRGRGQRPEGAAAPGTGAGGQGEAASQPGEVAPGEGRSPEPSASSGGAGEGGSGGGGSTGSGDAG